MTRPARARLAAVAAAAAVLATTFPGHAGPAAPTGGPGRPGSVAAVLEPADVDGDCHDDVPADPEPLPGATPVTVRVLLAVNGNVPAARGQELAKNVTRLYRPTGIDLRVTVQRVRIGGTDARELIDRTRALVGGRAPRGFDTVHLVTAVDITSQGEDTSIGLADCIGGIRLPKRAFSVSEISSKVRGITLGPVTGSGDEEARSAAHEIGHLLGARHEHSNCAQGAPAAARPTDSPCTIMFLAAPSSDVFGAVEAAVIRGYARRYAG